MGKRDRRWLMAVACSGAAACLGPQAHGQTATAVPTSTPSGVLASGGRNIEPPTGEIIVTAQKRSERLRDVPLSIVAATGDQLKLKGITSPDQLEKLVPGFTFNKTLYGQPVYFIRGVGFNDTSLGVSPAVSVYMDQLPITFSPMSRGATLDLERVEVLKGPQGTLFGQNSTGGAINFIAAKPTHHPEAGFDLSYGRFAEVDAEAFISGPISDTLSARLAVRNEYRGNWQRGYTTDEELGQKDFQDVRLIVDWKPTSRIKVELSANGWQDKSDAQQQQFVRFVPLVTGPRAHILPYPIESFPPAPNDDRAVAFDVGRGFRQDNYFYQFGARIDAALTDTISFASLTSYARFGQSIPTDFDTTTYPLSLNVANGKVDSFSQEARFSGSSFNNRVKWMVGGNYQKDKVDEKIVNNPLDTTSIQIGPNLLRSLEIDNLQRVETKAVFGSLDLDITEKLTLQGSARYTAQDRDFSGCLRDTGDGAAAAVFGFLSTVFTGVPQEIAPGACATLSNTGATAGLIKQTLNQDNVSWRASLNWKPDTDTLLYANITKGYKSGSFGSIPYANEAEAAPVSQESVLAYEVGAKLSALSRKLEITAAAFYYDYRDKQLNGYLVIPPFGPLPALVSIPKSEVEGGEISATFRPFDGLTLSGSATYVYTRIDSNPVNPTGAFGNIANFVGQRFPVTPKWQGVVDATYHFPVSDRLGAYLGSSVTVHSATSGGLLSGDPTVASEEALLNIPAYALVDLRGGLETPNGAWRFEVWGRNVTNKFYLVGAARNSDYASRYTGMPATYGISLYFRYH